MDSGSYSDNSSDNSSFITILSTGAYRVKGKINELNRDSIIPGESVIIRSRVDSTKTWKGTMGSIDVNNGTSDSDSNSYWGMMSTSDDQTSSTSYPFYVELDSSEDLMLGQHVYIERDIGQNDQKEGLWLSESYLVDTDTNEAYVWASNDKNKLEKRYVTLGRYDEDLGEYEIVDGLTKKDSIAFPTDSLEEGTVTEVGDLVQTLSGAAEEFMDMDDFGDYEDDMEFFTDDMDSSVDLEPYVEDSVEYEDGGSEDMLDPNEDLMPIDGAPGMSADMEEIG